MSILKSKPAPPPMLDEARIRSLQNEINDFIDAKAIEIKRSCEGVPIPVLRNVLVGRNHGCECRAFLNILAQDEAEASR
jgi:hypothetical protein